MFGAGKRSKRSTKKATRKAKKNAMPFKDVYMISLNTESERYKQAEKSAKEAGLTLKKWDGVTIDDSMRDSLMEQGVGSIIFKGATMRYRGAIGCFLAHRGLMRHIAEHSQKGEGTLILEDDVNVPKDFQERLQNIISELPANWDILYLDKVNPNSTKVTGHIHKFNKQMTSSNNWGNWAYIVRNSSLPKILPYLEFMLDPVDIQLHKFAVRLNIYLTVPSLITLNEGTRHNSKINELNAAQERQ
jgi:GR25 family glycosyltransferase involved in LPS biosynthesis